MRIPIMAANWKMHKTITEAVELAKTVVEGVRGLEGVEVVLCPPFTALAAVGEAIAGTGVGLGAQNMHWEESGAFTGEVSPLMLAGLCDYVILGHSERRQYFGETDEGVNSKVKAAISHGLRPIICVGENLEQNRANNTAAIVGRQVRRAFEGLSAQEALQTVIAYEPIWAIGTGVAAEPGDVNGIISRCIRGVLSEAYGTEVAQTIRIQYGGSVKPDNTASFMQQPDIDGALVGGASLKGDSFTQIVKGAL